MDLIFIIFLIGAGILAGFMSGLLGVGGGFIFAPSMFFVLKASGVPEEYAILIAFGTSLSAAFPTVITGAIAHSKKGNVIWRDAVIMGLFGIAAGFIGGTAAGYVPVRVLTILFGIMLIIGGIRLISTLPSKEGDCMKFPAAACIGGTAGFFSGLLGVGGGTILVPLMVFAGKFSMKKAAGTSAAAIAFITVGGILSYIINGAANPADLSAYGLCLLGYIDLVMWFILSASAVPMAVIAVKFSSKVSDKWLRRLFFILMMIIALDMFGVFDYILSII
ncbi:MAG TPA: sulfite exporter TauE/SafE family protein [Methanocorpusculum sp.]|nr:sulfite exporter TauE/SafE family protein [Methanocorpusculum sp.]